VTVVVLGAVASFFSLPCGTQLFAVFGPERLVYTLGYGVVLSIPGEGGSAVNDAVRVSSEADRTAREWCVGVSKGSQFLVRSVVW